MYSDSSVLDDVEFLVSSRNRLDVFDAIRTGPRTRHELRETTDVSRVTLSRILRDMEDREWIERADGGYAPTSEGAVVAAEVARLFADLEALDGLGDALEWLPVELFDFDLARLSDATVLTSTERDLTAAITHTASRVREAARVRNVATGISAEVVDAYLAAAERPDRSLETVLYAPAFDAVEEDSSLRTKLRRMLDSDRITVRRYEGEEPPVMLTVCDDVVVLCGQSNPRSPPAALETADERVRAWAISRFDELRAEATPVAPDSFTP